MKNCFKFLYGVALVGLLITACQKGDMPSPASTSSNRTTLMSLSPLPSSMKIPGKGQNNGPSVKDRNRSKSPNTRSYNTHKRLLYEGGYSPNTYDKHYNNYQKEDEKTSDY